VLFRHAPSVIDTALITAASHTPSKLLTGIYLHIRTPPCYFSTQATAPSALPHQPDPAPLTFRSPIALLSYHPNPIHESSAPRRRLAAGGATQRLASGAAGSLARWQVASLPSRHGCRAPACAAHSNTVRRPSGVVVPECPMPTVPCSPRPRPPSASACPASTRPASTRPASDVRCVSTSACPVSARLVSDTPVSVSGLQSPVSDVGCPVSGASVRHPVRVASVSALSAPVSSWSARVRRAATRLGQARSASHPTVFASGSSAPKSKSGAWSWPRWQRRHRLDPGRRRGALGWWPGSTAWPTGTRRLRAGSPVCRAAGARRFAHWDRLRAGRQERAVGVVPATPESLARGSSALGGPLADSASVRGPTAAQGGRRSLNSSPAGRGNPV
jgi:hypothetical protein